MFDIAKTKAVLWDLDDTLYSRIAAARLTYPGMFRTHLYEGKDDAYIEAAADFMIDHLVRDSMIHESSFAALFEAFPPNKDFCLKQKKNRSYYRKQKRLVTKVRGKTIHPLWPANFILHRQKPPAVLRSVTLVFYLKSLVILFNHFPLL